ncbi:MAG: hypothetical protein KBG28_07660 [Kofleriaceae bacterium]|nr:hypothetical protein [Kofleriaceae bacterium]
MRFQRAQGLLASTLMWTAATVVGVGTLAGCSEPELATNLRPDGPPDVLAFMVQTDIFTDGGIPLEVASMCRAGDEKAPTMVTLPDQTVVQVCPRIGTDDDPVSAVTNADPLAPQVRVVFDELLDPSIEQLFNEDGDDCTAEDDACTATIAATNPVSVTCGGSPVAYDGYYVPNGNNVTWPPGPSLVVTFAAGDIATGAQCQLTINDNVVDKTGVVVPADQRGPFMFEFAPMAFLGSDPEPDGLSVPVDSDSEFVLLFNALIDEASVSGSDITVVDSAGGTVATVLTVADTVIEVAADAGTWAPDAYTLSIPAGATFADVAGGTLTTTDVFELNFCLGPAFIGSETADGEELTPTSVVSLEFCADLDATATPEANVVVRDAANAVVAAQIAVEGSSLTITAPLPDAEWAPGDYTITIANGSVFEDAAPGTSTYTMPAAFTLTFTVPMPPMN